MAYSSSDNWYTAQENTLHPKKPNMKLMITLLEQLGGSSHPFDQVQLKLHRYMASAIELAPPDSACRQKCLAVVNSNQKIKENGQI